MDTIRVSKNYKPTRMCVCCKARAHKNDLLRFQRGSVGISLHSGSGRSFYICETCKASPVLIKKLGSYLKISRDNIETFTINIKEILFGQSSN